MGESAKPARAALALAALGIVFGDIGTSPLYAFRGAATAAGGAGAAEVLGTLSLIAWALVLSVSVKYVAILLRLNNDGEGGIIALAALLDLHRTRRRRTMLLGVALAGAALMFGDALITPAISVLAAIEGAQVAVPSFEPVVLPLAVLILGVLFAIQGAGTEMIARLFGPIMLVWFTVIGGLGAIQIAARPDVFMALDPRYALALLASEPWASSAILTAVFLSVTGGEALYADLGQFGRRAIATAWYAVVLPGLLLSYFGQGALVLRDPHSLENPFYHLVPDLLQLPMVALATCATIIASQAVISGIFSLARQAMKLDLMVPLRVRHTSKSNEHQVYVPTLNAIVGIGTIVIAVSFGSSDKLADAYGLAVAGAMITTTLLAVAELRRRRRRFAALITILAVPFILIDLAFFGSSLGKIASGGWLPIVLALVALLLMLAWRVGRVRLVEAGGASSIPVGRIAREIDRHEPNVTTPIVALMRPGEGTVETIEQLRRILGIYPGQVVVVSVWIGSTPRVRREDRLTTVPLGERTVRIDLRVGYLQQVDLPSLIAPELTRIGIEPDTAVYLLNQDRVLAPPQVKGLEGLAYPLFVALFRISERTSDRFRLPRTRTLEIGRVKQL